jgi:hypothetical protein
MIEAPDTPIADLRPHPRNYNRHPPEQLVEIGRSITELGYYRPIVATLDGTLLAGHGVVEAARALGHTHVPVHRLDVDPDSPAAWKVITADNELARMASIDESALAALVRDLMEQADLAGTGMTAEDLERLDRLVAYGEIGKVDPDAEWAGMPEFEPEHVPEEAFRTTVYFRTMEDADSFFALIQRKRLRFTFWPEPWDTGRYQTGELNPTYVAADDGEPSPVEGGASSPVEQAEAVIEQTHARIDHVLDVAAWPRASDAS